MLRYVRALKFLLVVAMVTMATWSAWAAPATEAEPDRPARAEQASGEKAGEEQTRASSEAPLVIFNRTVFVFRVPFYGIPPATRAIRARDNVMAILASGSDLSVSVKQAPAGYAVMLGGQLAFVVTPGDVDPLQQEKVAAVAKRAANLLEQVVAETREARSLEALTKSLTAATIATGLFVLLLWGLRWLRLRLRVFFMAVAERKFSSLKIAGAQLVESSYLLTWLMRGLTALRFVVIMLITYEWLSYILTLFPYTRPWGEQLNGYLLNIGSSLLEAILGGIPGLGVAVAIFLLARFFISVLGKFFERMASIESPASWLAPDTMPTTRRLFSIAIWLFAIAMAYPYLPGAQTEAFKGLSVLLGLMVSLGTTSIVGQGAAGLILTYTRTLSLGEYVRIGEHEGTVTRLGMFTTRIQTGLGEELTVPNSLITGAITKNYSRAVKGPGYVVDTAVTIGYDTPWRQVEAMLVEAARRTPGIIESPSPRVYQTALSDYYPEYRLVAQAIPSGAVQRAEVLTLLHANIQDVFNEYGVQIMSPHYMADPAAAKVVSPEAWYPAPAQKEL
jgi:small-conductance mechanosensitive channel